MNTTIILFPTQTKTNVLENSFLQLMEPMHTYIQINLANKIAFNYFSQQQPASSFTTVSNAMVLLCELRHQ